MIRTGRFVEYGSTIYEFASEEDVIGFMACCRGAGGRPVPCATQWRCVSKTQKVMEKGKGLER